MDKAFVYHGKVESLAEQVEEYRDRLNKRYLEIFGEKNYQKLARASQTILTPESFINTKDELEKISGTKFTGKSQCSKLILMVSPDFALNPDRTFKQKKVRIAPGFYVSDESFKYSGASAYSEKIIATYVHEFNHFAWLALQKTPFYVTESTLSREIGSTRTDEDIRNLIERLEIETARPLEQKREILTTSLTAYMMHEGFEQANRILDNSVLSSIGINASIPYRRQKKKFALGYSSALRMAFVFPLEGDYYWNLSDKQAINNFLDWEDYLNVIINAPFIQQIVNSVKSLEIQLLPLTVLRKEIETQQ